MTLDRLEDLPAWQKITRTRTQPKKPDRSKPRAKRPWRRHDARRTSQLEA